MTCQRCGSIAVCHYDYGYESFDRCLECSWQSNFATQRAEREEVTEWVYDEGDDDA